MEYKIINELGEGILVKKEAADSLFQAVSIIFEPDNKSYFTTFLERKYPPMKNKFLAAFFIVITALVMTSCYSSRKQGCPGNPQANFKFKG